LFSGVLLAALWWDLRRRTSLAQPDHDVSEADSIRSEVVATESSGTRTSILKIASRSALAVVLLFAGASVEVAATAAGTDLSESVAVASVLISLSGLLLGLWTIGDALGRARPITLQLTAVLALTLGGLAWGRDAFVPPERFSQGLAAMMLFSIGVGWAIGLLVYALLSPTLRRRLVGVLVTVAALVSAMAAAAQVLID
jgi:hypothetical protein